MTIEPIASQRPWWIFDALLDQNTTDICIARDNIRKLNTDPWWKRNYPPLHHRCRSSVRTDRRRPGDEANPGDKLPDDAPTAQAGWGYEPNVDEWEPDPTKWPVTLQKAYGQKAKSMGLTKPPLSSKKAPKVKPKTSTPAAHTTEPITPPKPPKPQTQQQAYMARKTGDARGSNRGGFYEGADGVERYVKLYDDPMQAYSEQVSNTLYRYVGIDTPESIVFHLDDGTVAYASRVLKDARTLGDIGMDAARADKVLDGYMADVWLGNWDAVGMNLDNIVDVQGRLYRIDNGGTLFMRAQAGRKPTKLLGIASEFDGLASDAINPAYSSVWRTSGHNAPAAIHGRLLGQLDSIEELADIVNDKWDDLIFNAVPSAPVEARRELAELLAKRTTAVRGLRTQLAPVTKAARPAGAAPPPLTWDQPRIVEFDRAVRYDNIGLELEWDELHKALPPSKVRQKADTIKRWTGTYSGGDYQTDVRATVEELLDTGIAVGRRKVNQEAAENIAWTIATRRERWAARAAQMGIDAPEEFVAYRGVRGIDFIEDVARAWDSGDDVIRIRSHSMASWSLAPNNPYSKADVVFKRTFNIDETFADQILDDAAFFSVHPSENEIVSMATGPNALTTSVQDVTVNFGGRTYTHADRAQFVADFRRMAKSAGRNLDF